MRYPQVLKPILARPEGNLKSGLNTFSAPTPCGADDIQPIRPHAFVDEGMGPDRLDVVRSAGSRGTKGVEARLQVPLRTSENRLQNLWIPHGIPYPFRCLRIPLRIGQRIGYPHSNSLVRAVVDRVSAGVLDSRTCARPRAHEQDHNKTPPPYGRWGCRGRVFTRVDGLAASRRDPDAQAHPRMNFYGRP